MTRPAHRSPTQERGGAQVPPGLQWPVPVPLNVASLTERTSIYGEVQLESGIEDYLKVLVCYVSKCVVHFLK